MSLRRHINPIHLGIGLSLAIHLVGLGGLSRIAPALAQFLPIEVELVEEEKPPDPPPKPPEPEKPPEPKPAEEVTDLRDVRASEVRDVFGVTPDSVAAEGDFEAPIGTTLMKEPEPEYVPLPAVSALPSFKTKIEPEYPDQARRAGLDGLVVLEVGIDSAGRVFEVSVVQSAGHGFDEAAMTAMKNSVFYPARRGNEPVAVRLRIPVRFTLR
ncbi:MAG: energy transducer TonB [Nitrospirae bacterium]|nr:energy transducer TonB [Nitrospirota bacterium]